MTILVISHTEHYLNVSGEVCGWGPTVRELDYLASTYGKVIHVACLDKTVTAPSSTSPYESNNVEFIGIPTFGGSGLYKKLQIIITAPEILRTVFEQLKRTDIFQFRSPTAMGVYLIPALTWFTSKKGWYKYAGNWIQKKKPVSYAFQKRFLESFQNRPVTINGHWRGQKEHIHTFENPSLTEKDLKLGSVVCQLKDYNQPMVACFVGRLEEQKGVDRIIENLSLLASKGIKEIHFVGDGPKLESYKSDTINGPLICSFHGFMNKEKLMQIYKESHLLLLPSTASEGFPKVIAEAANFGCVPLVSNVSSIPQYINTENGFVWDSENQSFAQFLNTIDISTGLKKKSDVLKNISELFTFKSMCLKLEEYIFKKAGIN